MDKVTVDLDYYFRLLKYEEKLHNLWDYLEKMKEVTTGDYKNAIKDIMHFILPVYEEK